MLLSYCITSEEKSTGKQDINKKELHDTLIENIRIAVIEDVVTYILNLSLPTPYRYILFSRGLLDCTICKHQREVRGLSGLCCRSFSLISSFFCHEHMWWSLDLLMEHSPQSHTTIPVQGDNPQKTYNRDMSHQRICLHLGLFVIFL